MVSGPHGSSATDRYVPALTGLRAVAAYLVFVHHYNPAPAGTFLYSLLAQGYIGVSVFFVLSGFLIYHRYADRFTEQESWLWRTYLWNRFIRIYPLYALLLLLTIGGNYWAGHPMSLLVVGLNFTLAKGFFDAYKFTGIAQSWSLTVEECFYLLAPLLFLGLRRMGALWLTILLIGVGLLLWFVFSPVMVYGFFDTLPFVLFYTFFGRAFEFVTGMWLAQRWHMGQLLKIKFVGFVGFILLVTCVCWQSVATTLLPTGNALIVSEVLSYNCLLPVAIGLLFASLLTKRTVVRFLLSSRVMQGLGRSSYAFYLIHIGFISKLLQKNLPYMPDWLLFIILVVIAHGLYLVVESPLYRWLSQK